MNRSVAMIMAGAVTTLVVIAGTLAISQSGALAGSTTIQKDGEIAVQVSPVVVSPEPNVAAETMVQLPAATETVEETPVAADNSTGVSDLEATLRARLEQAYKLMSDRDAMYQSRLKEAYGKLKQAEAAANAANATNTSATVQTSTQPVVVAPGDDHGDDNQQVEQHDDGNVDDNHVDDNNVDNNNVDDGQHGDHQDDHHTEDVPVTDH